MKERKRKEQEGRNKEKRRKRMAKEISKKDDVIEISGMGILYLLLNRL